MGVIATRLRAKRWYLYALAILLSGSLLILGDPASQVSAQAANSIYVTPASGNYSTGSSFTVSVRFNVSQPVNAVQADMSYSSNLEFQSIDDDDSALDIKAAGTGGNGSISIARGTTSSVTGDQLLAKVTFKVLAAGSASVQMLDSSAALTSSDNQNVISARNGSTYGLQASSQTPPAPGTPPSPTAPSTSTSRVKVTPSTGTSQTTVPDSGKIELDAPAVIEIDPEAGREVEKVEYLIDGKVVSVSTTAPYRHSIDTAGMRNGTYELLVKTYYRDGHIDQSKASLEVKNPFGLTQVWLLVKYYAWLIGGLLLIVGILLYMKFFRKPKWPSAGAGGSRPYGPNSGFGTPVVGGGGSSPNLIKPYSSVSQPPADSGPHPAEPGAPAPTPTVTAPAAAVPVQPAPTQPPAPAAAPVAPPAPAASVMPATPAPAQPPVAVQPLASPQPAPSAPATPAAAPAPTPSTAQPQSGQSPAAPTS